MNSFDYLVTTDNIPTELQNCSLLQNMNKCSIEVTWQQDPDKTTITMLAEDNGGSASTEHDLQISVGLENEMSTPKWEKVLLYECHTDQCNNLPNLKRLLGSLTMTDTLNELAYLVQPVKPFKGGWCDQRSNATFQECNFKIPASSCTQCLLNGIMNQTRTELCITCLTEAADKTELSHTIIFNMTDRTNSTLWMIQCEYENCNTPMIGDRIREKSRIDFDFVKFFTTDTDNKSTSISSMTNMALVSVIFLMKLIA